MRVTVPLLLLLALAIVLTGVSWAKERTPRVVRVLVLNFDPRVPAADGKLNNWWRTSSTSTKP